MGHFRCMSSRKRREDKNRPTTLLFHVKKHRTIVGQLLLLLKISTIQEDGTMAVHLTLKTGHVDRCALLQMMGERLKDRLVKRKPKGSVQRNSAFAP